MGMLLLLLLAALIARISYQQHELWNHVAVTEMGVIEDLDAIMFRFSSVHVNIHELLIAAADNHDEELIYEKGKPLLEKLQQLKKDVTLLQHKNVTPLLPKNTSKTFEYSLNVKEIRHQVQFALNTNINHYTDTAINAVEMTTVDWQLAREHMAQANHHYSLAIRELQSTMSKLREHIQDEMSASLSYSSQQFTRFIILSLTGVFIMLIGGFGLSNRLFKDIQNIINTINQLASGQRAQPINIFSDKNFQLQKVGYALEKFRIALQKLDIEIQQRKEAEAQLKLSAKVFESTSEGIFITDQNNKIVAANPAFEKITGYCKAEVLGQNPNIVSSGLQDKTFYQKMWQQLLDAGHWQGVLRNKRKNGELWSSWLNINIVDDEVEGTRHFVGVSTDITEHELLENTVRERTQELIQARETAENANQAKSEFLANMSHEIRTPINGVLGMTELLLHTKLDEQAQMLAKNAHLSAESLLSIINDILDFSKIEANKLRLDIKKFNLLELLENILIILKGQAHKKQLQLNSSVSEQLPTWVQGDDTRIRQVLINLLANAIKFTEQGEVFLKVDSKEEKNTEHVIVYFEVQDTGVGISKEKQTTIFSAFEQADNSTSRTHGGTGLGLAISKRLVELQGGQLHLQSELGKGSCFYFDIPLKIANPSQTEKTENPASLSMQQLAGKHILVAEDNKVNQLVAKHMLIKLGLKVTLVDNGKLALEALKSESCDLIFMDCHMPIMDGFQSSRLIREHALIEADIPIIALTADVQQGIKEKCQQAGMNDYLSKPFKQKQLITILSHWLKSE